MGIIDLDKYEHLFKSRIDLDVFVQVLRDAVDTPDGVAILKVNDYLSLWMVSTKLVDEAVRLVLNRQLGKLGAHEQ